MSDIAGSILADYEDFPDVHAAAEVEATSPHVPATRPRAVREVPLSGTPQQLPAHADTDAIARAAA